MTDKIIQIKNLDCTPTGIVGLSESGVLYRLDTNDCDDYGGGIWYTYALPPGSKSEELEGVKLTTDNNTKWAFTFGSDSGFAKRYAVFEGSRDDAQKQMIDIYGLKWAFQYEWDEFLPQIERHGLTEVK